MTWSVRARLTAWYSGVMVAVLVTAAVAVAGMQARFGLNRLDAELVRLRSTVEAIVRDEIAEGYALMDATREASVEVAHPGISVVVEEVGGTGRASWGAPLPVPWAPEPPDSGAATGAHTVSLAGTAFRVVERVTSVGDARFRVSVLSSLGELDRQRSELMQALWMGVLVALLVGALIGWLVARRALRPLTEMARQATVITERNPSMRLAVPPAGDELSRLAVAFNALVDRLSAALITEREFMADASHQLRTPVSVLQTTAQVLLRRDGRQEHEYRESMTIVAEQSARLARLVDAMFLLARAEGGGRALRSDALYLDEILAECVRAVAVLAAERDVRVSASGAADVAFTGDDELLRHMIVNLLENAVRYARRGGEVVAALDHVGDDIRLRVRDDGPGVPEADRERIFERFVRLEHASDGAGLGLPMARWIAEAHGGRLTLESTGPEGSCFAALLRGRGHEPIVPLEADSASAQPPPASPSSLSPSTRTPTL